jgi:hypothetical protein
MTYRSLPRAAGGGRRLLFACNDMGVTDTRVSGMPQDFFRAKGGAQKLRISGN